MNSSLGEECVVLITCSIPFLLPSWPFVLAWPCLCFCLTARPHMAVHPTHIPDIPPFLKFGLPPSRWRSSEPPGSQENCRNSSSEYVELKQSTLHCTSLLVVKKPISSNINSLQKTLHLIHGVATGKFCPVTSSKKHRQLPPHFRCTRC